MPLHDAGPASAPRLGTATAYLLSAALVLLGGYFELYGGGPPTSVVGASGGVILYETLLLLTLAYLYRVRGNARDALLLMGILLVFLLDVPMIQQRFGWEEGPGRVVAIVGFASGFAIMMAMAVALRLPLSGRMVGTLVAAMAFIRFGPILLIGEAEPDWGLVPGFVFLGWALSACLLPIVLLPETRTPSGLLTEKVEERVVGACLCAVLLHFLLAGISLGLSFRLTYLAPFLILLGPAFESVIPAPRLNGAQRLLIAALPYVGLAVSTHELTHELTRNGYDNGWTLTPFNMALGLSLVVVGIRARRSSRPDLWHICAGLVCLGVLARNMDLPEVLARLRYPEDWQVIVVSLIVWGTIFVWRDFRAGLLLSFVAALPIASQIAELGYSFGAAASLIGAWGVIALREVTHQPATRPLVLGPALVLSLIPLLVLLADGGSRIALGVYAAQNALGFLVGRWCRDRALRLFALASLLAGGLAYLALAIEIRPVPIGALLTRLGFAAFLLGILGSLFGRQIRARIGAILRSLRSMASLTG